MNDEFVKEKKISTFSELKNKNLQKSNPYYVIPH